MSGKNREGDDAYEALLHDDTDIIKAPQTETARARKWRILKTKANQLYGAAYQGFIIGSLVGGGFGFITGFYYAFQTRKLSVIPLSTLVSGASFGFIMACGSMIRSDDDHLEEYGHFEYEKMTIPINQYWRVKYRII